MSHGWSVKTLCILLLCMLVGSLIASVAIGTVVTPIIEGPILPSAVTVPVQTTSVSGTPTVSTFSVTPSITTVKGTNTISTFVISPSTTTVWGASTISSTSVLPSIAMVTGVTTVSTITISPSTTIVSATATDPITPNVQEVMPSTQTASPTTLQVALLAGTGTIEPFVQTVSPSTVNVMPTVGTTTVTSSESSVMPSTETIAPVVGTVDAMGITQVATSVTSRAMPIVGTTTITPSKWTPATVVKLAEKISTQSTLIETILVQKITLGGVVVSGDLRGTIDFTSLEIISIKTGSFADKGFSKGEFTATLEGLSYKGYWKGMVFLKPTERKIYLKGMISGEIGGVVEGYLTESTPGSNVYDQYQATWTLNRLGTDFIYGTINLSGTVTYQESTEYSSIEIYVLQTSIEGTCLGHYTGPLSTVLTHLRVVDETNPYFGEGFSIITYISDFGSGEGCTYDKLIGPSKAELKGMFTSPLLGIVSATLDETRSPRTLFVTIERIDLGLPPMPDLKVETWGPGRASPGQTVSYVTELRNDGLKAAENISLIALPCFLADFVSASAPYNYEDAIHILRWDFNYIPPKTRIYLSYQGRILWGLSLGITLTHSASIYPKEEADSILQHASPKLTEKQKIVLKVIETAAKVPLPPLTGPMISVVEFLGEEPFTPIIIANAIRANKAAVDGRFEEAEYLRGINVLLRRLQEDPDYLKQQGKTFQEAVEELATIHNYKPPRGATEIAVARDPNIKYGPDGNVLPGQKLDYKVEYENEGEGIAFGVYFTDTLDEDLDDSTLEIGPVISTKDGSVIAGPGTYNPLTRTITWLVGEVGPCESGFANFSVKVRDDAPEDTEIINFGIVYFPSVPEITRTNAVISIVKLYIDTTPPTTLLTIGEPKYVDPMENIYVTSATSFTLTAEDDPGGSGVASTAYRIYNATYDCGWLTYTQPFYLIGLSDGTYTLAYNSTDNAGNIESINTAILILDNSPPILTIETPLEDEALQDGITFTTSAWDLSKVASVTFSIREPNGELGKIISPAFESMPATLSEDGKWKMVFDTTQLPDGYYLTVVESTDVLGNKGFQVVSFSIRNWATIELLPASETNKAGRTMPVKFSLRIVASVDPNQPFVRNEELTIIIFEKGRPEKVLQTSTYGTTARDYRIDDSNELYITNFQTLKTPTTYVVQIYRKGMLIGTFEFSTVK